MPKIYDNIELRLYEDLEKSIRGAKRADFCTGYFNLRGWDIIADEVDILKGEVIPEKGEQKLRYCRLLIGMQKLPEEELRLKYFGDNEPMTNSKASELKKLAAQKFKKQLQIGLPENRGELAVRKLLKQLKEGRVVVKLQLKEQLHAKLYITHQEHHMVKYNCFLGSSNLTFSGLSGQGELNIDVVENDAAEKLNKWFEDRWNDRYCVDISDDLIDVIENSWAAEKVIPPYHIYLKMAYHLSMEAQKGILEYRVPSPFRDMLFDFQAKAVQTASIKLNTRGGVLIGDVVGLGKTFVAAAVAKVFQEEMNHETLILCPKNLTKMWTDTVHFAGLVARVISESMVHNELPELQYYRTIIIDESHNLRNTTGRKYQIIKEYLEKHNSKVILLSATPYNKEFLDIANQLRLFIGDDEDLGIAPENLIAEKGGISNFKTQYPDILPVSIAAFAKSEHIDDWRELMRLFMVRRTRGFIIKNYAKTDPENGRKYLQFPNGKKSFFPDRVLRTIRFDVEGENDQYAQLYTQEVLDQVEDLDLPRYGLFLYRSNKEPAKSSKEEKIIQNLTRAGNRMIGICKSNFFKRLDSSGHAFILTLRRHILRNFVFIYALKNNKPLPIGSTNYFDFDEILADTDIENDENFNKYSTTKFTKQELLTAGESLYSLYSGIYQKKYDWIDSDYFSKKLLKSLLSDCESLIEILNKTSSWDPNKDKQLAALYKLISETHKEEKVLIFTEYSDTAKYVHKFLCSKAVKNLEVVWGDYNDPTTIARRFSPVSNQKREFKGTEQEIRVLISTDVLSEGQNLQDAHIVINYDLPWAIIGLIQRAGRVDRIGQESPEVLVYSLLPDKKLEDIIKVIEKLKRRISESANVLGGDEGFFDDQLIDVQTVYGENSAVLDKYDDDDGEVDLTSYAWQIWKNATDADPSLKKIIADIPNLVYSAKTNNDMPGNEGVIVYTKTSNDTDVLEWRNKYSEIVSGSHFRILRSAACSADTPAVEKLSNHHELVAETVKTAESLSVDIGKSLITKRSVAYKVITKLEKYYNKTANGLFRDEELKSAMGDLHKFHLKETARDTLLRAMKNQILDEDLRDIYMRLRDDDRLFIKPGTDEETEKIPSLVCSLGLINR